MEHLTENRIQSLTSEYIQAFVWEEQQKRERFYDEITEQQKAEFINGEIIVHSPVKIEHNSLFDLRQRYIPSFLNLFRIYIRTY